MRYADESRGKPFSKDPAVVHFDGRYFMYYSLPPFQDGREPDGWSIGIAQSEDLLHWEKAGELYGLPDTAEKKGIAAPGALVHNGRVHLFYQTYGNGRHDAICHAVSDDGVHFERDASNPIFSPEGEWNAGRAIDADVIAFGDQLLLYFATRDPAMKIQMLGVAAAPLDSDFSRSAWTQLGDGPILKPELDWEQDCIEAPALCVHNGKLYMFYAGAYNNKPQQIGCAVSEDGVHWTRISDQPVLPNGKPDEWNSSESGHPYLFTDDDGAMYLFYQGNNDQGKTWRLSWAKVEWASGSPIIQP
ncbi:MAG: family 43 glycosylhydrolase [bacterium]|nr:family 43 glycosylhydrolase [bacterium]